MIKLLHAADIHIGITSFDRQVNEGAEYVDIKGSLSGRLVEVAQTLKRLTELAYDESVDIALFAGDIFHRRNPWPYEENLFARAIKDLIDMGVQVVVLVGNHEITARSSHVLDVFKTLAGKGFHLLENNSVIRVETEGGPVEIAGIPWTTSQDARELLGKDFTEDGEGWREYFSIVLEELASKLTGLPSVLAAHAYVPGASNSLRGIVELSGKPFIPLSLLSDTPFDYIALGHIHTHQSIPAGGRRVFYSGSLIRTSFNEESEEKGVMIVEIDGKRADFVPFDTVRKMLTVEIDLSDITSEDEILRSLQAYREKSEGKIVRIIFRIPENMPAPPMSLIREALQGAWHIVIRRETGESSSETSGDFSIGDPLEILGEYLDNTKGYKGSKDDILDLARRLIEEDM